MKASLVLLALCATLLTVNCLPATEETKSAVTDAKSSSSWLHPMAYQYMMCRMECKRNCMEQGYWYGNCRGEDCFCYGYSGAGYPRMKEVPVPMF